MRISKSFYFILKLSLIFIILQISSAKAFECNFEIKNFSKKLITLKSLKNIEIQTSKSKSWFENTYKIISSSEKIIKKKYKKKFSAKVKVNYKFGSCIFKAKIRQNGDWKDHIQFDKHNNIIQSLDIQLNEGNIAGITKFKIFIPSTRHGIQEIIFSDLLSQLDYLAPRTTFVNITVNNLNFGKMIFQEKIAKEMLENLSRKEGPVYEGNEKLLWENSKESFFANSNVSLTRQTNTKWSKRGVASTEISLDGIIKLQNSYIAVHQSKIDKLPNLDWKYLSSDSQNYYKNIIYDFLLSAAYGFHALTPHNRVFYFNSLNQNIEPIYYDGNININEVNKNILKKFNSHYFPNDIANHIDILVNKLNTIQYENLENIERISNYKNQFKEFKSNLIKKLLFLKKNIEFKSKQKIGYVKKISKENFENTFYKKIVNGKLVSLINYNDKFTINECNKKDCYSEDISLEDVNKILSANYKNKVLIEYEINKPIRINTSKYKILNNYLEIIHTEGIDINVDNENRLILNQKTSNDWAMIDRQKINDLQLNFIGSKEEIKKGQRFNSRGLTGCLTINNSIIKKLIINYENSFCEDAINIINSRGTIDQISIQNSKYDGLDIDFSKINISNLEIINSENDCLDLSYGHYYFNYVNVEHCNDKGISVGENSFVDINSYYSNFTNITVASKDNSEIKLNKFNASNFNICLSAYNKKQEFWGGKILINKNNCNDLEKFDVDNFSLIIEN